MSHLIFQLISFLVIPFLGPGLLRTTRARAQGKRGPSLFQPWYDIFRVLCKYPIDGPNSGFFAEVSPILFLIGGLLGWSVISLQWAPLLFLLLFLAIQYVALICFGMETGTSFGGLGASREIVLTTMAKPILIFVVLLLGTRLPMGGSLAGLIIGASILLSLTIAILAELSKPPFDDPRTHLELTMVHEAMLLEASGARLAFFEIGAVLKQASLLMLLSELIFRIIGETSPLGLSFVCLVLFVILGYWEAISVRRKWSHNSEVLGLVIIVLLFLSALLTLQPRGGI